MNAFGGELLRGTVDRIEGDCAVVEVELREGCVETFDLPLALMPSGIEEGYKLSISVGKSTMMIEIGWDFMRKTFEKKEG